MFRSTGLSETDGARERTTDAAPVRHGEDLRRPALHGALPHWFPTGRRFHLPLPGQPAVAWTKRKSSLWTHRYGEQHNQLLEYRNETWPGSRWCALGFEILLAKMEIPKCRSGLTVIFANLFPRGSRGSLFRRNIMKRLDFYCGVK